MKTTYRGHEIEVVRERCLGGWPMLYVSIFRVSDGYECETFCEDSAETVRDMVTYMKERIDAELASGDPWEERADQWDDEDDEDAPEPAPRVTPNQQSVPPTGAPAPEGP